MLHSPPGGTPLRPGEPAVSEAKFTPHYLLENFREIYFAERSGELTLRRGEEWRRLYFDRGMLALADSSVPGEGLEAALAAAVAQLAGRPVPVTDLRLVRLAEQHGEAVMTDHERDAYVRRVVEQAGELTPEHLERIRALLPPVRQCSMSPQLPQIACDPLGPIET